jgi:hypothetical protein
LRLAEAAAETASAEAKQVAVLSSEHWLQCTPEPGVNVIITIFGYWHQKAGVIIEKKCYIPIIHFSHKIAPFKSKSPSFSAKIFLRWYH